MSPATSTPTESGNTATEKNVLKKYALQNIYTNIYIRLKGLVLGASSCFNIYIASDQTMDLIYLKSPTTAVSQTSGVLFCCVRSGGSEDQQQQDAAEPNSYK